MKKIFTSFILAMLCVSMQAVTTMLFEGRQTLDWGDGVQVDGSRLADAQVGDQIVVTTENGGFKLCSNYPWATLTESDGPTGSYTITAEAIDGIKSSGIRVQGGEDVSLLKIELVSDAPEPSKKVVVATLLDQSANIGNWDNTIEIAGDKFDVAKLGDCIRINYTTSGDAQLQLCANSPSWHNILDCTDLSATKAEFDFQLTDEIIADLKADKLYIQGKNITVSSVQLVRDDVADGIDGVQADKKRVDNAVYTIDGKRLGSKPQHGMYIMNGKKFMMR